MNICAELRQGITTDCAAATRAIATQFAGQLPPDTVLALHGDMGVGKTTFVQGLALGLGVQEPVTSPTFAIYSVYAGTTVKLVHLDAYRLDHERQLEGLMLEEFLTSPWCLAIEWPEKTGAWLPARTWHLTLSIIADDQHHLQLMESTGPAPAQ